MKKAIFDIYKGFFGSYVWYHLAWQDIKQRYHRSKIGPFWLTISTGIMITAMGPLYAKLFSQPVGPYFQHLAVSIVVWTFVSTTISETCMAFISAEGFIKDIKLPLTTHLLRVVMRNILIFSHNFPVVIIVLVLFPPDRLDILFLMPVGLLLVIGNLLWIGLVLAILCARFRDIPQLVTSLLLLAFFISPIVWRDEMLGSNKVLAYMNPLYHFVELIRTPMLGKFPSTLCWLVMSSLLIAGSIFALLLFKRYRCRIAYWI